MSAGGGSLPGNTAVKQEGNISGEVSQDLGKEKEHSKGRLFPSMQHRTKMRGVHDDVSQPPHSPSYQHEILHKVQSMVLPTSLPATLETIFVIFLRFLLASMLILTTHHIVYISMSHKCPKPGSV